MSSYSYMALITPKEKTPLAMSINEGTFLLGLLLGNLISGPIADATDISTLAYINAGFTLIPLIIVSVFMTDALSSSAVQHTWKDIIGIRHLLDAFKCILRKRQKWFRLLLILAFLSYSFGLIAVHGSKSDYFLYFVKQRGMSLTEYSIFNSLMSALQSFGGPAILWVASKFDKQPINSIMMGACASMVFGYTVMAIDSIPYSAWIGCVLFCTQIAFFGEIHSYQTSLVEKDELGKMFAFVAIIQIVIGAACSIGFKTLYAATLTVWPAMFLVIAAGCFLFAMIVITLIDRIQALDTS